VGLASPDDRLPGRGQLTAIAAVGLAVALGELAALDATGRLLGPSLLGGGAVAEQVAAAVLGAVAALIAGLRRNARLRGSNQA
jgi:hypothetical protein